MALVKLPSTMLTLDELCAEMVASGRCLTPRVARDWWTKGLLPRPSRRGLGRGEGTETFWTYPRITEQARAAYDLLSDHCRVKTALLGLWLLGFQIELSAVRKLYGELIERHMRSVDRPGQWPDNTIGDLAAAIARQLAKSNRAPPKVRNAITDLISPALENFYGVGEGLEGNGLAHLWKTAAPYLEGKPLRPSGLVDLHPTDDDLEKWLQKLRETASLTAQHKVLALATDYEMIRARRLLHFVFWSLVRLALLSDSMEGFDELGRRMLLVFGRPAVPILIIVLRDNCVRHRAISFLLDLARRSKRRERLPRFRLTLACPVRTAGVAAV